ncbi:hypothetical protein B0T16DRAFT_455182 [Cercophora newfieldiana]|uniref:Uncharacterized protein n=1 Tax=Cercophora newfieldiana TaxID=92897 RepID=A0AA40CVE3_9PEZI|nr:hypothetical protein B0T16DRAFT_455182 [Cercophora newfieldiana]
MVTPASEKIRRAVFIADLVTQMIPFHLGVTEHIFVHVPASELDERTWTSGFWKVKAAGFHKQLNPISSSTLSFSPTAGQPKVRISKASTLIALASHAQGAPTPKDSCNDQSALEYLRGHWVADRCVSSLAVKASSFCTSYFSIQTATAHQTVTATNPPIGGGVIGHKRDLPCLGLPPSFLLSLRPRPSLASACSCLGVTTPTVTTTSTATTTETTTATEVQTHMKHRLGLHWQLVCRPPEEYVDLLPSPPDVGQAKMTWTLPCDEKV